MKTIQKCISQKIREFIDTNITVIENLEYMYNCENNVVGLSKIDRADWIKTETASRMIKDNKLGFIIQYK